MLKKPIEPNTESEESERLFKNPILDFLTRNHVAVPLVIFYGGGIIIAFFGILKFELSILNSIGLFFIGILTFTLIEYLIHRYIYHLPGVYTEGHVPYAIHGIHHKYPKDKKRLVMPPVLSILIAGVILGINYLIFGLFTFPFTAGILFGYAAYLTVHFAVHRLKPPNNFLKQLWVHHSIHHYKNDEKAFGVSSPLWDYVFGTLPEKQETNSVN